MRGTGPKLFIAGTLLVGSVTGAAGAAASPSAARLRGVMHTSSRGFVENRGQWDARAAYGAPGFYGSSWVTREGELRHLFLGKPTCPEASASQGAPCRRAAWVVEERFMGARALELVPTEQLPGGVSFLVGADTRRHVANVPTFASLRLGELWPGIAVRLRATQATVEKVFELAPGASPEAIRMELRGASGLRLEESGHMIVSTGYGNVVFSAPIAWQHVAGEQRQVRVAYRIGEDGRSYGFSLGSYDPSRTLWIDPIVQSTYLGGSGDDDVRGIAIHPTTGDVYVVGATNSNDFPVTLGAFGTTFGPTYDAFVARINAALTSFLQVTYFGGNPGQDEGWAIALDPATGNVFIGGITNSTTLPNTTGAAYTAPNDIFIARLDANLTSVFRTTFFGGTGGGVLEGPLALVVHPTTNELVVLGQSGASDLPQTSGSFQSSFGGGLVDYFLARFALDLASNPRTSYLGGNGNDFNYGTVVVHPSTADLYVAGYTNSPSFPGTTGGAQPAINGPSDAFVARVSADLGTRYQVTYLGSTGDDWAYAVAVAPTGNVYVGGMATTANGFPGLTGGFDSTFNGGSYDGFVTQFTPTLATGSIVQSTLFGGDVDDYVTSLFVHPTSGEVYAAGDTGSSTLPTTTGGAQPAPGGNGDAFVARLNAALTANPQTTYFGGTGGEFFTKMVFHPVNGDVYLAGRVTSLDLPGRTGGAQANKGGGTWDGYVARLTADLQQGTDMAVTPATLPAGLSPAASYALSFSCTNTGTVAALNATCGVSVSTGSLGSVTCSPAVPVASLPTGGTISCTATFTAPGPAGGGDIAQSGTSFTFTTSATNDSNAANNSSSSSEVPLVDAVNETATLPPNTVAGANLGTNDQYGTGPLPGSATFSLLGATTCGNASINPTTGVATFDVPPSGTCVVAYQVCVSNACDTAELFVTVAASSADMSAAMGALPPAFAPGVMNSGLSFSCENIGGSPATNATCGVTASVGTVSGVFCTPSVPVASLPSGASIVCTFSYTAPGTAGGSNTLETGVTFTFTTGADNDSNTANNTVTSGATPIPLVDALDDAGSFPANTAGATFNVGSNDQYGTGTLPGAASFSLQGGTTCAAANINATTGVATFNVPASGTCVVAYQVCVGTACDTAQLVVTAQQVEPIPTLQDWGFALLVLSVVVAAVALLRRP